MTDDVKVQALAAIERHRNGRAEVHDEPLPPEPPDEPDDDSRTVPLLADHLLNRSALRNLPDPAPLIDNVLDQGTVALLYGKWGTGKSFIAQDLGASVSTGRDWQGRATEQRRVVYVAAEGAFGLKARLDAWETGWQTKIADGDFDILPRPVNLTRPIDVGNLAALISWGGYGLVIIDTLSRCMVGAEENSAKDCGLVVDAMTRLREHTPGGRGVVLAVHHAGKDGKTFRGNSAFEAGADTVYFVAAEDGLITLDREKRKDGPQHDRHTLRLETMPGTGSCVIGVSRDVRQTSSADTVLSHIRSHFGGTGASATQIISTTDISRATVYRALTDLAQRGDLTNIGTEQRPHWKPTHP